MNYQNIRLDKSLYKAEGGFTKQLESLDPSEHYTGSELAGLDAFQRQLKRFNIKVSGPSSDSISKFFATSDSAALFPEYVSRAVAKGCDDASTLEDIVASVTEINSLDYRSITTRLETFTDQKVKEGQPLPEVNIALDESLVKLYKRGRLLSASYEAIKHQRTDIFTVALKQIGRSLAQAQLGDAIETLVDGAAQDVPGVTPEMHDAIPSYKHMLDFWSSFTDFELNVLLVAPSMLRLLMDIPEFSDCNTGNTFVSQGSILSPFGAKIITSEHVSPNLVLGLDKNYALEMVTSGGVQVEYDKLIDTQLERAAISSIYGFSKIFPEATRCLVFNV